VFLKIRYVTITGVNVIPLVRLSVTMPVKAWIDSFSTQLSSLPLSKLHSKMILLPY
jgi:hypothetical protein